MLIDNTPGLVKLQKLIELFCFGWVNIPSPIFLFIFYKLNKSQALLYKLFKLLVTPSAFGVSKTQLLGKVKTASTVG
jgi:hypothetical protein